jgi:hypothetical protein
MRTATAALVHQARINVFAARAFAKAEQIESSDSSQNRTMWNRLKVAEYHLRAPPPPIRTKK